MEYTRTIFAVLLFGVLSSWPSFLSAQGERELGWSFKAQLSSVWLGGNSESSTFGFGSTVKYTWPHSTLTTSGGSLRTESTIKTRRAVGTTDSFRIDEETDRETTAETFFARSKFDHDLSERIHVLGGLDWLRDTFSGIDSRFLLASGAGLTFSDTKELSAKADLAFTYTFEEEVVDNPFSNGNFPGLRASYAVTYQASPTTQLESELIGDWNLDNSEDVRADWSNAMSVAVNSSVALKPSTLIRWRNDPALKEVNLFDEAGEDTGESVLVPLEKIDWFLNLAIVLKLS
jgi:putative salt-induced outer membrane protein YdiY